MGLAMTSRVQLTAGNINDWIGWEPVLRALFDGRKVHETGDVTFSGLDGTPLALDRSFTLDDDREEIAHFLREAGFLHIRGVFDDGEMAAVSADIDEWIGRATPDDGESWWAEDEEGLSQAVRVLSFYREVCGSARRCRNRPLPMACGPDRRRPPPRWRGRGSRHALGIVKGLSDLPWHKDCGQGRHSYMCNSMTTGISVTGADRVSGALGVIPGSHRANTMATGPARAGSGAENARRRPAMSPCTAATRCTEPTRRSSGLAKSSTRVSGCRRSMAMRRSQTRVTAERLGPSSPMCRIAFRRPTTLKTIVTTRLDEATNRG